MILRMYAAQNRPVDKIVFLLQIASMYTYYWSTIYIAFRRIDENSTSNNKLLFLLEWLNIHLIVMWIDTERERRTEKKKTVLMQTNETENSLELYNCRTCSEYVEIRICQRKQRSSSSQYGTEYTQASISRWNLFSSCLFFIDMRIRLFFFLSLSPSHSLSLSFFSLWLFPNFRHIRHRYIFVQHFGYKVVRREIIVAIKITSIMRII